MKVFSFLLPLVTCMQVKDVEEHTLQAAVPDMSSIREMLLSYAENAGKIDDVTAGAIQLLLTNLNTTIFEALYADRAIAQQLLDDHLAALEECNTNRTNSFNGAIAAQINALNETYEDLEECKENETSAGSHVNETCEEQEEVCDAQDVRVRKYASHGCGNAPQDGNGDSQIVYDWFFCVANFTQHHCDEYEDGHEECDNATEVCEDAVSNHTNVSSDCDTHQGDFESDTCELAAAINLVCDKYEGCYDTAHHAWEEAVNAAHEMYTLYTAQMKALEQIMCFGSAIINNYTDYDHCEEDFCDECPNMGLTVLPPHERKNCTEAITSLPCEPDWITANYGDWTGNTDTAMAVCQACPDVEVETSTNAPTTPSPSPSWTWQDLPLNERCHWTSSFLSLSTHADIAQGKAVCGALHNCHGFMHVDVDGGGPIPGSNTYFSRCLTPWVPGVPGTTSFVKSPW